VVSYWSKLGNPIFPFYFCRRDYRSNKEVAVLLDHQRLFVTVTEQSPEVC
jgi:hypothetical protein